MCHKVMLLDGEWIRNTFGLGNSLKFHFWIKIFIRSSTLMLVVGFKPTTSKSLIGRFHTRGYWRQGENILINDWLHHHDYYLWYKPYSKGNYHLKNQWIQGVGYFQKYPTPCVPSGMPWLSTNVTSRCGNQVDLNQCKNQKYFSVTLWIKE